VSLLLFVQARRDHLRLDSPPFSPPAPGGHEAGGSDLFVSSLEEETRPGRAGHFT